METKIFTYLVGGKAGEGVKKAGSVAAHLFSGMGRRVFQMDDYQSLIRGGHNFSVVSTAVGDVTSHYEKADLVVALDKRSYQMHKGHVKENGILVYNSNAVRGEAEGIGIPLTKTARRYPNPGMRIGVGAVAVLAAAVGLSKDELKELIEREYRRDLENNVPYAFDVYDLAYPEVGGRFKLEHGDKPRAILSGNQAIALGAAAGGLDAYFAYPMTPASSILHYFAAHADDLKVAVVHPENEIAVINMAIGAASVGARAMLGSSGGGLALMQEAFSMAGMAEVPLVCVLSSRPGPSTGVPTYTDQGDLYFALYQGHGEFPRFVASPGTIEEAFYLTAELLDLVWRFQTPAILVTEKHLSESSMTVEIEPDKARRPDPLMHSGGEYKRYLETEDGISPLLFPPSGQFIRWNSYEHDEAGITTEVPEQIVRMRDKRNRKYETMVEYMRSQHTVNVFGDGGPVIYTYGSTVMSVLEALRAGDIRATVVQPIYLEPFPLWEIERYGDGIVVELSSTGVFARYLREKAGINAKAVIRRYDGRPFDPVELAEQIKEAM